NPSGKNGLIGPVGGTSPEPGSVATRKILACTSADKFVNSLSVCCRSGTRALTCDSRKRRSCQYHIASRPRLCFIHQSSNDAADELGCPPGPKPVIVRIAIQA